MTHEREEQEMGMVEVDGELEPEDGPPPVQVVDVERLNAEVRVLWDAARAEGYAAGLERARLLGCLDAASDLLEVVKMLLESTVPTVMASPRSRARSMCVTHQKVPATVSVR